MKNHTNCPSVADSRVVGRGHGCSLLRQEDAGRPWDKIEVKAVKTMRYPSHFVLEHSILVLS